LTQVNVCSGENLPNLDPMLLLKKLFSILPPARIPLRIALGVAPERLLTPLIAALFTQLMRGQPLAGRLTTLAGKRISIVISDLPCELRFRITAGGLASGWSQPVQPAWDVRIRGVFDDFWLMATRAEDPDTLFFQRRLAIEGDTETGLVLKNLLDALEYDWPAHIAAVLGPLAALRPRRR
jgi:predicted lipid carrier protein YhbT